MLIAPPKNAATERRSSHHLMQITVL